MSCPFEETITVITRQTTGATGNTLIELQLQAAEDI